MATPRSLRSRFSSTPPAQTDSARKTSPLSDPTFHQIEALTRVYDTPPYEITRMAYLELCLVVSDLLFIDRRKTFLSGRGRPFVGRLSADLIYSTLCSDSEAEIRDAGGLTSICSVPARS